MARARYLAVILAVSVPLALGACEDSESSGTNPDSGTSSAPEAPSNQTPSGGDDSALQSKEALDALTAFAACMRKQGVNVSDPDPKDPSASLHSLDQSDPEVARSLPACQDKLAALNAGP